MRKLLKLLISSCVILMGTSECSKRSVEIEKSSNLITCDLKEKKINDINDQIGIIYFNKELNRFCVYVGVDGTFDSQIVAVPCNLPKDYEKESTKIKFSGTYYNYPTAITMLIPGQVYHQLNLNSINSINAN